MRNKALINFLPHDTDPGSVAMTIDRREVPRRAALALGSALSAPVMAYVLAGQASRRVSDGVWQPRALTPDQVDLVASIAEHILPETDTPGARAVGVHRFIDALLAESYAPEERRRFLTGLADVEARARRSAGCGFLACPPQQQRTLLEELDRETYAAPSQAAVSFFRTMKELTLVGYYTSEIGATRELRHVPIPGRFEGCVPLTQIGRTWAV